MNTSAATRSARLKAAQSRWAMEDRQRGYTTYRGGRPYSRRLPARARRSNDQLKETLLLVSMVFTMWVVLVAFG